MENKLYSALVKAQSDFEVVEFDMVNSHFKNRYASLASIRNATHEALAKNGLGFIQPWDHKENGDIVLYTKLIHESGEELVSSVLIPRGSKNDQQIGSSLTYHRRYQLASMLGVSPEDDDDAEVSGGNMATSNPLPKKKPAVSAPVSYDVSLDPLKDYLKNQNVPAERLKEWLEHRAQARQCNIQDVIKSCAESGMMHKFKESYSKWLSELQLVS